MSSNIVEINHVVKNFGNTTALDDVTFTISKGQVFGYLGPNGAGKTTTIRILLGLLKPDKGTARLLGEDPYNDSPSSLKARNKIGVALESPGHFAYTTVYRNLAYHAKIQQIDNIEERVTEILKQFELWDKKDKSVNTLSKGMMQKLAIARSLLHDPDILFFDEPTSGLDPNTQMNIRNLVKELAKSGKTVLLSSHN